MFGNKLVSAAAFAGLLALSPFTFSPETGLAESTACAAEAAGNCRDAGCIGGNSLCADLSNGTRCYTTIIIEIDEAPDAAVAASAS